MPCTSLFLKKILLSRIDLTAMLTPMKNIISKFIFIFLFSTSSLLFGHTIQTNNTILAHVGKKAITALDVKREMDRQLYLYDKTAFNNPEGVFAHYNQNWKYTLKKIVQDELMLLEAEALKFSIPSHEITKKTTELYGDSPIPLYQFLSITPEEAKENGKRELYSMYLSYLKIWDKCNIEATPKEVQKSYQSFIKDLPMKDKWIYQAMYVQGKDEQLVKMTSNTISQMLKEGNYSNLAAIVDSLSASNEVKVGMSKDIKLTTKELSPSLLAVLENLEEGMMSDVITGQSAGNYTGKVLHLKEVQKEPIPEFSDISDQLRNSIVTAASEQLAEKFFNDLIKKHGVEGLYGKDLAQSQLVLFTLNNE